MHASTKPKLSSEFSSDPPVGLSPSQVPDRAAHALRRFDADVTVLDKNNYHTFQPLLHQVSTGYLPPEEVGAALRAVFRR
jgi:NADH dehydrogenase FAD-containing subunit